MKLYTSQYLYVGPDRLDITVKGKDPTDNIFAPTWKMVMESKEGKISWDDYKQRYKHLMQKSYRINQSAWAEVLGREEVTLVCFCKSGSNCHRYLLSSYLEKLGTEFIGERIS